MGSKAPLDELLAPVNVRFNFDSGFPARPEWRDCLATLVHPVTHGVQRASDAVISVGASLNVQSPAFTLVRGRYGFSDLGNQLNGRALTLAIIATKEGNNSETFLWSPLHITGKARCSSLATPALSRTAP